MTVWIQKIGGVEKSINILATFYKPTTDNMKQQANQRCKGVLAT